MTNFKYICSCGCRVDRKDIQVFSWRENGKQKRKMVCPIHSNHEAVKRVSICKKEGCNKEIVSSIKGGGITQYCPEHAKERLLEKKRRYARKYWEQSKLNKSKKEKIKEVRNYNNIKYKDLSKTDCLYRRSCLDKYINYDCIPCKDCKRYTKGGFIKDFTKQGGYGLMDTSEISILENYY